MNGINSVRIVTLLRPGSRPPTSPVAMPTSMARRTDRLPKLAMLLTSACPMVSSPILLAVTCRLLRKPRQGFQLRDRGCGQLVVGVLDLLRRGRPEDLRRVSEQLGQRGLGGRVGGHLGQ